jgi:hypothetical protein
MKTGLELTYVISPQADMMISFVKTIKTKHSHTYTLLHIERMIHVIRFVSAIHQTGACIYVYSQTYL